MNKDIPDKQSLTKLRQPFIQEET